MLHDIKRHRAYLSEIELAVKEHSRRCYAIVPAAGRSRRMGQPKLLLPWGDGLLIDQVLRAWTQSQVSDVVVVIRQDDAALTAACRQWPVRIVHPPSAPPDMKASLQIGLQTLKDEFDAANGDACFIAPADLPTLNFTIIDRLIAHKGSSETIVVPRFGETRGHPALLPWALTDEIFELGEDEGANRVVDRHPKHAVDFSAGEMVSDVDTLEEYQKLHVGHFGVRANL